MSKAKKIKAYVVKNTMKDTSVVLVEEMKKHKKYLKSYKNSKKIKFDDRGNKCKIGDFVEIEECRPISKEKSWKLSKIINKIDQEKE